MNCLECDRPTRPKRSDATNYPPGMVRMHARGLCDKCYSRWKRGHLTTTHDVQPTTVRAERIEDIEFLLRWDHNAESVARRAGFTNAASASRYLHKHGRHDLARQLDRYGRNVDVYSDRWASGVAA